VRNQISTYVNPFSASGMPRSDGPMVRAFMCMVKALSARLWFGFGFYSSRRLFHLLVLTLLLSDTAPLCALPLQLPNRQLLPIVYKSPLCNR